MRAYISERENGIASQSLLDADVPLIGIRHLVIVRIHVPVDETGTEKRRGGWIRYAAGTLVERIANGCLHATRMIQVLGEELAYVWPCSFIILSQLNDGVPAVIESAVAQRETRSYR